jgi:hypothetical protein
MLSITYLPCRACGTPLSVLTDGPQMLADLVRRRRTFPLEATDLRVECAEERSIVWQRDELIAAGRVTGDADGRYRTTARSRTARAAGRGATCAQCSRFR